MNCVRLISPGTTTQSARAGMVMVEADAATPWVPEGKSCWEFGTKSETEEQG